MKVAIKNQLIERVLLMPNNFPAKKHPSLFALEESILEYWQKEKIFEKSLEQNKNNEVYSFYDGPPFITGHSALRNFITSIAKDVIPTIQTMKGKYVRRNWGLGMFTGLPSRKLQLKKKLGFEI